MAENVQQYYDRLTEAYLDRRNDEDAKCKNFRPVLEDFFRYYVCPGEPNTATFFDLQKLWHDATGDWPKRRMRSRLKTARKVASAVRHQMISTR